MNMENIWEGYIPFVDFFVYLFSLSPHQLRIIIRKNLLLGRDELWKMLL